MHSSPTRHGRVPHVAAALASLLVGAALAAGPANAAADPGEVIVRFDPGASAQDRSAARGVVEARLVRGLPVDGMQLVRLPEGAGRSAAIARLERSRGVLYAEPNAPRRAAATSDPYFGHLWGLDNTGQAVGGLLGVAGADIDAPAAWQLTTGSPQVPVAVVDSGVAAGHPDLARQMWSNSREVAGNRVDDDRNGYVDDVRGWDWVDGDGDPADANGHGTHVAGTIAARGDDATGVVGVAPSARVMPLRVLDAEGYGDVAAVISAYGYAARAGVRVVNLSLGGQTASRAERDALAAAGDVLFAVAAGNGGADGVGDDNDAVAEYPCNYNLANVVCVAASDSRDRLAGFSNRGLQSVDLAAPGVNVLSDQPPSSTGTPRYTYMDGTSMATPHVAGAAALAFAVRPGASVAAVRSALLAGVDLRPAFLGKTVTGGRLNARRTLDLLQPVPVPVPVPPVGTPAPAPTAAPVPAPAPEPPAGTVPDPAPAPGAAPDPTPVAGIAPETPAPVEATAPGLAEPTPDPDPAPGALAPGAPGALAPAGPGASAFGVTVRQPLRSVRRSGLRLRLNCPSGCAVSATLRLSSRDARRTRLARSARGVRIAAGRWRLGTGANRAVTMRLSARARRALRTARGRLRTTLTVRVDGRPVTRQITLTA